MVCSKVYVEREEDYIMSHQKNPNTELQEEEKDRRQVSLSSKSSLPVSHPTPQLESNGRELRAMSTTVVCVHE